MMRFCVLECCLGRGKNYFVTVVAFLLTKRKDGLQQHVEMFWAERGEEKNFVTPV